MVKKHYTDSLLSARYNCNFEAINQVLNKRMKKLEMEYGPFICTIIFYLIVCIRFRRDLRMLSLREELLTFLLVTFLVIAFCRYNYHLPNTTISFSC